MSGLSEINIHIQRHVFPALEEEIVGLSQKKQQFVRILELVEIKPFLFRTWIMWYWATSKQSTRAGQILHCQNGLEYSNNQRPD